MSAPLVTAGAGEAWAGERIAAAAADLAGALQPADVVRRLVRHAGAADGIGVLLRDERGYRVAAAAGTLAVLAARSSTNGLEGALGALLAPGAPSGGSLTQALRDALALGAHAEVRGYPLRAAGGAVGLLLVDGPADHEERATRAALATVAGTALANARLFEQATRATREWRVAFDAVASGMAVLDERGRVLRCNARALELAHPQAGGGVVGRTFEQALLGDDAVGGGEGPVSRALRDGVVARGALHASRRGLVFSVVAAPHPDGGAVVTFEDVTAHHTLAERHRRVIETASDAIIITDRARRVALANPAAERLFGRADLVGVAVDELVPPEHAREVAEREARAFAGEPQRYESFAVRPDGERRIVAVTSAPLAEVGQVIGIVASLRDVTEERARSIALERSEARYTRLVELAADAIFTVDAAACLTSCNRAFERATGRDRADAIGRSLLEFVDPRDHAAALALLDGVRGGGRRRAELRYMGQEDEVRVTSVTAAPTGADAPGGALIVARDVTDERRLGEQLLQQEKLAAVGTLVAGVAHELNNPLAGISAFSQVLLAVPGAGAETRQAAETIRREAGRAARIVSSLLTFARQHEPQRSPTDVNAVVHDVLELRRYALRAADIALELSLAPRLPVTHADPYQLQQVLVNLLTNAEQAMVGWQGERRVRLETATRRAPEGEWILVRVADTGPGIAAANLGRVFNPFFTTKGVGQGTGLGLSISDGIVREHGGRLRVESTPGRGAAFLVELPVTVVPGAEPAAGEPVSATFPAGGRRPARVLHVEDEAPIRHAVAGWLAQEGVAVVGVAGGDEALDRVAAEDFDAVILDAGLPGRPGLAIFEEIGRRRPELAGRVVFVTGEPHGSAARAALARTGRPVIGKPFSLPDLLAALTAGLGSGNAGGPS